MFDGSVHDATLTEIPVPADAAAREALLHRVRALAATSHPCLVPVADVEVRPDGVLEVRRAGAGAADLATVLAVRGALTPPEAAGVLVSVAQALAALHGAGLAHGPLEPRDVVVGTGGGAALRPRLEPGARDVGGPAGDVHAVALLVEHLVGRHDDEPATALRAVLAAALAPDPEVRPEAGTLAAWAHDAVEPRPVRLPEPAALAAAALGGVAPGQRPGVPTGRPGDERAARRRRRAFAGTTAPTARTRAGAGAPADAARRRAAGRRGTVPRGVAVVGAVAVAVVALTAVALEVRGPGTPVVSAVPTADTPAPSSGEGAGGIEGRGGAGSGGDPTLVRTDPAGAAAELTRRRVDVLAAGGASVEDLGAVSAAGSPALAADAALLGRISQDGAVLDGTAVVVRGTDLVARPATDRAEVAVTYALGGGESRTATLALVWTTDGWRVQAVS